MDRLGYEYPEGEDADETMLRALAVGQASAAGDVRLVAKKFSVCYIPNFRQGECGTQESVQTLYGDWR